MNDAHQKYFPWLLHARQDQLSPGQQAELSQHLANCPHCAGLQALSGQFSGLAAEFRALAPPPGTFAFKHQSPTRLQRFWAQWRQPAALLAGIMLLVALLFGLNYGIQRLIPEAAAPGSRVSAPGLQPGRGQQTAPPQSPSPASPGWLENNTELLVFSVFILLGGFGLLLQELSSPAHLPRNWLLFLLAAWMLVFVLALWAIQLYEASDYWSGMPELVFESLNLVLPLLAGALLYHPIRWRDRLASRTQWLHALLCWGSLFFVPLLFTPLLRGNYGFGGVFVLITPGLAVAGMIHSGRGGRREAARDLVFAGFVLIFLFMFAYLLPRPPLEEPVLPSFLVWLTYLVVLPILLVGLFARWLYLALKTAQHPPNKLLAVQVLVVLLSLWLLVSMIQIESAAGTASDNLSGGFSSQMIIVAAACAGVYLVWLLRGLRSLVGVVFALLIIAVIFPYRPTNFTYQPLDAGQITAARAGRILAGLEDYHDRTGVYPLNLWQLAPFDLLYIPRPFIYADLGWCYLSDGQGYRFGYVYTPGYNVPREYIELREFSGGQPPTGEWSCDRQLGQKRAQAPPLPPGAGD